MRWRPRAQRDLKHLDPPVHRRVVDLLPETRSSRNERQGGRGSRGDSYDNALAESVIGLYKTEVIYRKGPWRGRDDVEYATLDWVDWFNNRRLLSSIGWVPPAEHEESYDRAREPQPAVAGLN